MQVDMIGRLVRADLARLRSVHSGQFVSSMLYDASLIREAATSGAVNWVREALTLIALMIYMASVDFVLTICVLVMAPVAARLIRTFSKRTTRAATGAMAETSALSTAILESLDGVKIVKLENRESYQEQRVGDVVRRRQGFLIKGSNAKGVSAPVTETLMTFIIAGIIGYATWRASHGSWARREANDEALVSSTADPAQIELGDLVDLRSRPAARRQRDRALRGV